MKFLATLLLALALVKPVSAAVNEPWTEDDFTPVSSPASPYVAYALRQNEAGVSILVDVARIGTGGAPKVDIGLGAVRSVILSQANARVLPTTDANIVRYAFTIPAKALVLQPSDWDKLRMAFAVAWPGGPAGADRQRERFLHTDTGATFDPLSPDPQAWQPFDLKEQASAVANRKKHIYVDIDQPLDGKATIVIDDDKGHRVRNLMSGQPLLKGPHRIEWDGLDDIGNVVASGSYRWRAISHPGITPKYLFSFYNEGNPPWRNGTPSSNWLADHSNAVAAAAFGTHVYLGAPIAESGQNVVQLNLQGDETNHLNFPTLVGVGKLFLLADATGYYAVMEGNAPYEAYHDLPDGSWELRRPLNVMHWDNNSQPLKYNGPRGEKVVTDNIFHGTGAQKKNAGLPPPKNLGGAALLNGKIYISLRQEKRITILNAASGADEGEIKLDEPGLIGTDGKSFLIAFSGKSLVKIDPASNAVTPLFTPTLSALPEIGDPEVPFYGFVGENATGIAVSPTHEIFLSDNGVDQNVKVFSADGKLLRQIGKKGGRPINGAWDGSGMYRPHGIALDQEGKLWVTETDTFPRRNSVWDAKTGAPLRDFFGPSFYGADLASFDTADHTRWIGGGEQWKLDFAKKTATPVSTLYHQTKAGQMQTRIQGKYWNFYHKDGRTFLIGNGEGQSIYELRADGSLKLWAFCSPLSGIAQMPRWTLPKAITDLPAVQALFEANAKKSRPPADTTLEPFGTWGDMVKLDEKLIADVSILWVDKNGDDIAQPDEFEVLPAGDSFRASAWGVGNPTLDLKIPAMIGGKPVLLPIKADGFLPSGAPNYSLAKAVAAAVPIDPGLVGAEAVQDHSGREIFNSSPMKGLAPDGHTLWSFPNKWVGVHGSHEAPLPERGVMQGALYFLGTAPLDAEGEVFVMNGNHGRFFVLTTDGMYLDEMFKDVRVAQNSDAYLIGGECFGGYFGKTEDGKYYLQSGHTDYRIFELDGLDQIKRSQGNLEVSAEQMLAAQANTEAKVARVMEPRFMDIEELPADAKPPSTDPNSWPAQWAIHWGTPQQPFPYVEVKAMRGGDKLYLAYRVKDPSPWVNQGKDWTMLFKTGDSVDFQFSTDPKAKPDRNSPVPGDKRLLIAPFQGKNIAVLYSYREPGAKAPMSFSSPWRAEKVDSVTELKTAKITAVPGDGTYTVCVTVPLADLGLPPAGQAEELRGDFGVIYGDTAGSMDLLRSYWSNQATGLVNDVPGEIMIVPRMWGTLKFQQQQ